MGVGNIGEGRGVKYWEDGIIWLSIWILGVLVSLRLSWRQWLLCHDMGSEADVL